jgi:hypothetical protein
MDEGRDLEKYGKNPEAKIEQLVIKGTHSTVKQLFKGNLKSITNELLRIG